MTAMEVARPMPRTLYDHAEDIRALYSLVEALSEEELDAESHGAALQQIGAWFAEVGDGFDEKVERCLGFMRELEARRDATADESARLEALSQRDHRAAERLRDLVQAAMTLADVDTVRTTRFGDVRLVEEGGLPAVDLYDPELVPWTYCTTPEPRPAKEMIRAAILAGRTVPGARLREKGKTLRIPSTPKTPRAKRKAGGAA